MKTRENIMSDFTQDIRWKRNFQFPVFVDYVKQKGNGMFGTEGNGRRAEGSRGEVSWNVLIFSIFRSFSPSLFSTLHSSPSIQKCDK